MIWQWLVFFASVGLLLVLVVVVVTDVWPRGAESWVVALFIVGGLGVLFGVVTGGVLSLSRHYGRVGCRSFAAQTNRPTKFVIYTAWDTGDCLTPDGHGRWIPTKNLREFGETP